MIRLQPLRDTTPYTPIHTASSLPVQRLSSRLDWPVIIWLAVLVIGITTAIPLCGKLVISKNGAAAQNVTSVSNNSDAHWMNQVYLRTGVEAADEYEMVVLQKSGGALNFAYATFWMVRIGPTGVV